MVIVQFLLITFFNKYITVSFCKVLRELTRCFTAIRKMMTVNMENVSTAAVNMEIDEIHVKN